MQSAHTSAALSPPSRFPGNIKVPHRSNRCSYRCGRLLAERLDNGGGDQISKILGSNRKQNDGIYEVPSLDVDIMRAKLGKSKGEVSSPVVHVNQCVYYGFASERVHHINSSASVSALDASASPPGKYSNHFYSSPRLPFIPDGRRISIFQSTAIHQCYRCLQMASALLR
jgi:hypothetical protein